MDAPEQSYNSVFSLYLLYNDDDMLSNKNAADFVFFLLEIYATKSVFVTLNTLEFLNEKCAFQITEKPLHDIIVILRM